MDPVNERKVFIQLVESACKPGTPQCFLLTPKLLPGLPYAPPVTVLLINNGPHVAEQIIRQTHDMRYNLYGARAGGAQQQAVVAH